MQVDSDQADFIEEIFSFNDHTVRGRADLFTTVPLFHPVFMQIESSITFTKINDI